MPAMTAGVEPIAEGLNPDADFRRAHGIPPKGPGPHADSEYGFPLPPANHPDAKAYARAVLSRVHQSSNFDPADVAKQVAKARRILGEKPNESRENHGKFLTFFPLREIAAGAKKGTATVIVIVEGQGSSGYYPASTLVAAVNAGLFEGAQCYYDHPTPTEDVEIPGRSVRRLAGWFSDAKMVDYTDPERGPGKAVEAIFHPQVGDEDVLGMLQTCVEYAKRYPTKSYVALSINACGEGHDGPSPRDGTTTNIIDELTEVISIDLVTRAGAGGKPIAFRESYMIVKKTLKEQFAADMRDFVKGRLSEAAVQLSPEQDQAIDSALGVVDGGPLDRLLDQITGVGPGNDDDNEETDDVTDAEKEAKEAAEREKREAAERERREAEDEVTEADAAPFADMSKDDLVKKHVALLKKQEKRESDEEREKREAEEEREKREAAARRTSDEQLREAKRVLKATLLETVLGEQNVPENFRPRLTHEVMREADVVDKKQIAAYVTDWVKAYVPQGESYGGTVRESRAGGGAKLDLTFAKSSAYD